MKSTMEARFGMQVHSSGNILKLNVNKIELHILMRCHFVVNHLIFADYIIFVHQFKPRICISVFWVVFFVFKADLLPTAAEKVRTADFLKKASVKLSGKLIPPSAFKYVAAEQSDFKPRTFL